MASGYPASLDTFATTSPTNLGDDDSTARNHAERHDDIGDAMNKVQAELGTDPAGAFSTVKGRLDGDVGAYYRLPMIAGQYFAPGMYMIYEAPTADCEFPVLFIPQRSCTIDRLAVHVQSAGGTGSVMRLGMRTWDTSTGKPGTLIVDGGTVSTTSTGAKEVTVSQAVTAGVPYVLTASPQGGTSPTMVGINGLTVPTGMSSPTVYTVPAWRATGTTGALPSTQTWAETWVAVPRIWVRTSA